MDNNLDRSDPEDGVERRLFWGDVAIKMCDVGKDVDKDGISIEGMPGRQ